MMVLRFLWVFPLLLGVLSLPSTTLSSTTSFKEDRQSCHIFNSGHSADCVGRRLDRVPWMHMPSTLVEVDLSYNELSAVFAKDFSHLPNLQILQLQYNNISLIEDDAFKFNPLLEHLDLFNNSLREIPARALQPLTNLKHLLMSNNMYQYATLASSFSRFLHLKTLSMGGPLVEGLKKGDFHPMKNIKLQNFAIKCSSNLSYYELGSLDLIQTQFMGLDMAIDQRPNALTMMLQDLANKSFTVLQFRNLFEFKYYVGENDIFSGLKYINAHQLIFHRGKYNENLLRMALVNLQISPVKKLRLQYIDFARSPTFEDSGLESSVTNLALDRLDLWHISNPDILRFDWRFTWFSKIRHLSIQNVNFNFVPCDAWLHMGQVKDLDVSNNRLFDNALFNQRCEYFGTMSSLRYFDLSTNYLTSLRDLSLLTGEFGQLHILDVSNNQLGTAEKSKNCDWKQNITHLIAHHNPFENDALQCLPTTVQVLDLSYCDLDQLDINYFEKTTSLKELLLSGNKIKFIPSDWKSPSLQSLALDGNSFGLISMASFQKMPQLSQLKAGNNPYHCTCDLHTFIQDSMSKRKVNITDWPINYKCYHPEALLNTLISEYFPGHVACDIRLVVIICVVVTATVVLLLMLLCYKFNVAWYIRATYQIIRAKYRAHKEGTAESQTFAYDAFISYSHYDADWVRDQLLPCLETSKPPYNLCIHERDFMPGKWIIDNIIENIEHSGKVIFVLSHHFVDSEWCNYELYFAQQRAIGKTFSDVILVVKEPIDPKSLPSKYCKLKKMLYTKTYIEWPQQANQQVFFWAQLKSVLGKPFLTRKQEAVSVRQTVSSSVSIIELPLGEEKPQIAMTQLNGKEELQRELLDDRTEIVVQRSHPVVSQ